jgi:hypothetical protein
LKVIQRLIAGVLILLLGVSYAETTVPLKMSVSAVVTYSDGALINTIAPENITIGLYLSQTEPLWIKSYSLIITDGLIEATLAGTGVDANGNPLDLNEGLFEYNNLKVGFTIQENGVDQLALVELTSQPFALKSAIADVANMANDTTRIQGTQVSARTPDPNQVLVFTGNQWMPASLNDTMVSIDGYTVPDNDVTEVSGTINNLKVNRLLGKRLTTSEKDGENIPTGAILMFSPDVDAPNGAFYPSSGNPLPGEVLTWDGINTVWTPSANALSKLTDVVPTNADTPTDNVFVYDKTLNKYVSRSIGFNALSDVAVDAPTDGQLLRYNGSQWVPESLSLNRLTNVTTTMTQPTGKYLYYDGSMWNAKSVTLQGLADVDSGLAAGNVLVGKTGGTRFEYKPFDLDSLTNVNASAKQPGQTLVWNGSSWTPTANTIQTINQLNDVTISSTPAGRYLYHDGLKWVDKVIEFATSVSDLSDVSLGTVANNHVLRYDSLTSAWKNTALSTSLMSDFELDWTGEGMVSPVKRFLIFSNGKWRNGTIALDDMRNVLISGGTSGQVLTYNGTNWVNGDAVTAVSALNDVQLTGLADGHVLQYNNSLSKWENKLPSTIGAFSQINPVNTVTNQLMLNGHLVPVTHAQYDLGTATKAWRHLYLRNGTLYMGNDTNQFKWHYDATNKYVVIDHYNGTATTNAAVNIQLKDGLAVVGDTWTTAGTVQPLAVWNGTIKNKISRHESSLVFNTDSKSLGLGVASPASALHVKMTAKNNAGGMRLSTLDNTAAFLGLYQGIIAGDDRTPYVIHADRTGTTAMYHDIEFKLGTQSALYMAIQKAGETGLNGFSGVDAVRLGVGTQLPQDTLDVNGGVRTKTLFVGAVDGVPTTNGNIRLHVGGDAAIDGSIHVSGGADLAEGFRITSSSKVAPGTVVSIDPNQMGYLKVSTRANDTMVAGVVSGGNGIQSGLVMTQTGTLADGEYPIALVGRVWVNCDNTNGAIVIGDLLTTASTPGKAMKSDGIPGTILGKALSTCSKDGMVLALISLQ